MRARTVRQIPVGPFLLQGGSLRRVEIEIRLLAVEIDID